MPSQGPLDGDAFDSHGDPWQTWETNWWEPRGAQAADGEPAYLALSGGPVLFAGAQLRVGAEFVGEVKGAGDAPPAPGQYAVYGGEGDLWGLPLTPDDVNGLQFGCAVRAQVAGATSWRLWADNFGFAVPASAAVTGVKLEVRWGPGFDGARAQVEHLRLTVYWR